MPKCIIILYCSPSALFVFLSLPTSLTWHHGIWTDSKPWLTDCLVCLRMISFLNHVNSATGRGAAAGAPEPAGLIIKSCWSQWQWFIYFTNRPEKTLQTLVNLLWTDWSFNYTNILIGRAASAGWDKLPWALMPKSLKGVQIGKLGQQEETLEKILIQCKILIVSYFKLKLTCVFGYLASFSFSSVQRRPRWWWPHGGGQVTTTWDTLEEGGGTASTVMVNRQV